MRVGQGFDAHRFDATRPLVIGGVEIEGHAGLSGHSDADVLSHAIADALLGAAGLGDLGERFPGNDRWKDASSLDILSETAHLLHEAGFDIVNVDSTVIAEAPRLADHKAEMVDRIASALGVDPAVVSVKATTTDGLGATGRREGIAATAVALITS
ncbi:MAG: 2-C-methyl-D-erythritol 2,4-cyclodiphosphate synthase [Actinomycetota bacterium]